MNLNLKQIVSSLILVIGLTFFLLFISSNKINFALIALTLTLILWVLFSLLLNVFDISIFAWILSISGFLMAISVFFLYGIEEVPYPVGALLFHSSGFAGALGISLVSLFPILILYHINTNQEESAIHQEDLIEHQKPNILSDEWEITSDIDLQSDEFDIK